MVDWLQFSLLGVTPYDRLGWFWLIENYQQSYLYLPLLYIALLTLLLLRPVPHAPRWTLGLLAINWMWCGGVFQLQYHATVNWAAPPFGWVFIVQGGLIALVALFGSTLSWRMRRSGDSFHWRFDRWPGLLLLLLALFYPLIGWFEGRSFLQLEWLGLMPAPLTFATLGVLLLCIGRWRLLLLPIPLLWMLVSAVLTWKLDLLEPYIVAVVLLVLIASVFYTICGLIMLRRGR